MNRAYQYIADIYEGKILACKWARLAVERQVRDLERQGTEEFPYIFVEEDAQHVLDVFDTFKYTKGKWRGKPFEIMDWQAFIVTTVYGWRHMTTGKRRFRDVYIKVPRKNAKTELLIGVAQYGFVFEGEIDPEIYWFATKKEQAKIGWGRQKVMTDDMILNDPGIAEYCKTNNFKISTREGLGWSAYLSKDSKGEDGPSPYYGIADEYHAHPDDSMIEVIVSGMGARESPILWRITTAGTNFESPCKAHEEFCQNILERHVDLENTFAIMYEIDKDDDPNDPSIWEKANPAWRFIDTLPDFVHNAWEIGKKKGGTTWVNFLTKNLNVWSDVIEHWIDMDVWKKYASEYDYTDLLGRKCFGGLDLASTRDTNALCLFFPPEDAEDKGRFLWYFWIAKNTAKEFGNKHKVNYVQWNKQGYIAFTPGNAVDYARIASDVTGVTLVHEKDGSINRHVDEECPLTWFDIDHINYDRKFSPDAIPRLQNEGLDMRPMGQGFYSMSAPTKMFEAMIVNGLIDPGNNPVADWQFGNIVIEQDSAENIKITKNPKYQRRKVDGMQAAVMAVAGWMDWLADQDAKPKVTIDIV